MGNRKVIKVQSRNEKFAEKLSTKICREIPSPDNPYVASKRLYYGYDLIELISRSSYQEVLFLLFRGTLPSPEQCRLLDRLMIALSNPGPRHNATRAAMVAGGSKTQVEHLLPISLSIMSGEYLGAREVKNSMNFIRRHRIRDPLKVAGNLLDKINAENETEGCIAPGFGSEFNGVNIILEQIASALTKDLALECKAIAWASEFVEEIGVRGYGWLATGLAAAAFLDLGFNAQEGPGLYQLLSAPGLLAHGVEMVGRPVTDVPFVKDENYIIESDD